MNVEELRAYHQALNDELAAEIQSMITDFSASTGVSINQISVTLMQIDTTGESQPLYVPVVHTTMDL